MESAQKIYKISKIQGDFKWGEGYQNSETRRIRGEEREELKLEGRAKGIQRAYLQSLSKISLDLCICQSQSIVHSIHN